jgi:hypothetical protein
MVEAEAGEQGHLASAWVEGFIPVEVLPPAAFFDSEQTGMSIHVLVSPYRIKLPQPDFNRSQPPPLISLAPIGSPR